MQPIIVNSQPCYVPPYYVRLHVDACPVNHNHGVFIDVNALAGFELNHWEIVQLYEYMRKQGYLVSYRYVTSLEYLHTHMHGEQCGRNMSKQGFRVDYLSESGKLYLEMFLNHVSLFLETVKRYP